MVFLKKLFRVDKQKKKSILLITEKKENMTTLALYLSQMGWMIHYAISNNDAIKKMSKNKMKFVVIDKRINGVSNISFLRTLREESKSPNLPAILMVENIKEKDLTSIQNKFKNVSLLNRPLNTGKVSEAVSIAMNLSLAK